VLACDGTAFPREQAPCSACEEGGAEEHEVQRHAMSAVERECQLEAASRDRARESVRLSASVARRAEGGGDAGDSDGPSAARAQGVLAQSGQGCRARTPPWKRTTSCRLEASACAGDRRLSPPRRVRSMSDLALYARSLLSG